MPRVKNNVIPIPFNGIAAEDFDSGSLRFSHLDQVFLIGEDLELRKNPGRASGHLFVMPGDRVIPQPERETVMTVELYQGTTLVASGSDTVAPPGPPSQEKEVCDPACIE